MKEILTNAKRQVFLGFFWGVGFWISLGALYTFGTTAAPFILGAILR